MKIVWTDLAVQDIDGIYQFIAQQNPEAALRVVDAIYQSVESKLNDQPHVGRPGRVADTRELVITGLPFIVPYRVHNKRLLVLRVIHAARQWPVSL